MTAKDIADVALDGCTDDDMSCEGEQKHESGDQKQAISFGYLQVLVNGEVQK